MTAIQSFSLLLPSVLDAVFCKVSSCAELFVAGIIFASETGTLNGAEGLERKYRRISTGWREIDRTALANLSDIHKGI
jgi:hypothetical protein